MIQDRPRIAAVIPSLNGNASQLENSLAAQSWPPDEIYVVKGVQPSGRARNQGVSATNGEILVFIDDDALLGGTHLVEHLLKPLLADQAIGVTGVARTLPQDARWFQRRVATEIPRTVNPIPLAPLETNPPLRGYGHSLITTTCCAMHRSLFVEAGGFREDLTSGEDTDLFYRIRKLGYRFMMVPQVYVEHPAPDNLGTLINKFYWYGKGYGQEAQRRPEQRIGPKLPTRWHRLAFLMIASIWLLPNIFVLYSLSYPRWELGFRPLKAISTYAVAWGYAWGWRDDYPFK